MAVITSLYMQTRFFFFFPPLSSFYLGVCWKILLQILNQKCDTVGVGVFNSEHHSLFKWSLIQKGDSFNGAVCHLSNIMCELVAKE